MREVSCRTAYQFCSNMEISESRLISVKCAKFFRGVVVRSRILIVFVCHFHRFYAFTLIQVSGSISYSPQSFAFPNKPFDILIMGLSKKRRIEHTRNIQRVKRRTCKILAPRISIQRHDVTTATFSKELVGLLSDNDHHEAAMLLIFCTLSQRSLR
jgi:hypothetical protein